MKVTIEIKGHRIRKCLFSPTRDWLRPELDISKIADVRVATAARSMLPRTIPGARITVDTTKRTGRIDDPMLSEADIRDRAEQQAHDRNQRLPEETRTFDDINPDEWLFRMIRMVEAGKAVVMSGELPPMGEVKYTPPDNPHAPKPKCGKERLKEIFHRDPRVASEYARMNPQERSEFAELAGA